MEEPILGAKLENLDLNEVKKCAIYVRYSINNSEKIEENKNKLIKFCKDELHTDNYEVFIEVASCLDEREVFNSMLKRFETDEFSHLVTIELGRIYKPKYNRKKLLHLIDKIRHLNITIISVKDGRYIPPELLTLDKAL